MSKVRTARGTHDLIGEEQQRFAHIVNTTRAITNLYGFDEWATPIFEDTSVFARSLGDTSDIVSKEMYTFQDRGGDSLTLRPEGTASICRALVTNGLTQSLPQKVFYTGPMFRYERPQGFRYRQFHQVGAELLGVDDPFADAEVIAMAYDVLKALGIAQSVVLELNTLGDNESRQAWRAALIEYFSPLRDQLSEDSQIRLEKNPLRILDSKDERDKAFVKDAPLMKSYLTEEAQTFWDRLRQHLDAFKVPFSENPNIVRGLDYYSHTTFEFVTNALGTQGTVLAGGRYNGLVQEMGGPATPAIGWAAGVERLAGLIEKTPQKATHISIIPIGEEAQPAAMRIMQALRHNHLRSDMAYKGNLKKRMEGANKIGADFAVLIGEEEVKNGSVQLKNLVSGEQKSLPEQDLIENLKLVVR